MHDGSDTPTANALRHPAGAADPAGPEGEPGASAGPGIAERRRHRRARVLWGGVLRVVAPPGEVACTVADISAGGAKLLVPARPEGTDAQVLDALETGCRVVLSLRASGEVPGRVAWQHPGRVGLAFDLTPAEVRAGFPGVVPPD